MCAPIYKFCSNDEIITMEKLNDTIYEKCYFPDYEYGKTLKNPRKVKQISIPMSENIQNVDDYFNYLIEHEGYSRM